MAEEITFVTWKWALPGSLRSFSSEHVNILRGMISRYAPFPHRFVCITDNPRGLSSHIDAYPMPETGLEHILPATTYGDAEKWPSCYRRLWIFSDEAQALGDVLFLLDIDCIITGDISPLVAVPGDFVGWIDARFGWKKIAGAAYMLRSGTHCDVWEDFDPCLSPQLTRRNGRHGSDQAWISYKLFPPSAHWMPEHGLMKLSWISPHDPSPPVDARMIFTSGLTPPWDRDVQHTYPWIRAYWRD